MALTTDDLDSSAPCPDCGHELLAHLNDADCCDEVIGWGETCCCAWQGAELLDGLVDETLLLDGSKCPECKGTIVAEPVEAHAPVRLRCRDCGRREFV